MNVYSPIITKERLSRLKDLREASREEVYRTARSIIGKAAVAELRELYGLYDERMYLWMAALWDPELGAFYYSNSARDYELYLPDIESTAQIKFAIATWNMLGESRWSVGAPRRMLDKMGAFAYSLQAEDGFFYHPQWGREVSLSRRGRDYSWSRRTLNEAGLAPKYPLPTAKSADGKKSKSLPDYLQDIELFKKWLAEKDLSTKSYYIGNILDSTTTQITAAGQEFVDTLVFWLAEHQREDNGLWQEEINYDSVNGLMKISGIYPTLKAVLPNAMKGLASAIRVAMSDERMKFVCEHYNPWVAMCNVFKGLNAGVESKEAEELRHLLWENSAMLIKRTREKISVFRKDDGSFSFYRKMSASISQGSPAALPRQNEGDVNATCISQGTARNMCTALGIPGVPVFTPADGELFFELIEAAPKIVKKYKNPGGDTFPPRVPYSEEIAE